MASIWVLVTSFNSLPILPGARYTALRVFSFMKKIMSRFLMFLCVLLSLSSLALAESIYQEPNAFLEEVFATQVPEPKMLWLTGERKQAVHNLLDHDYGSLRIRYWGNAERSAWILDEIGKEHPITTGIVVKDGKIELVRVLIFRESRGWEVRYPFFTDQFQQATLTTEQQLDRSIDNISGATLSVRALTKLARMALYLASQLEAAHVP